MRLVQCSIEPTPKGGRLAYRPAPVTATRSYDTNGKLGTVVPRRWPAYEVHSLVESLKVSSDPSIPKRSTEVNLKEFIEDALDKEQQFLLEAVQGLTPEDLVWRAGPEANPIGWILWHMIRVEDMWLQFFIQERPEIWERDGWHEKFGLPTRDNGFGHTQEQVDGFPALELSELLKYGEAVRAGTLEYLRGLGPEDYDRVPRERRPEMTIGAIFRQVVGELYQHQGHIAYLKGLADSSSDQA